MSLRGAESLFPCRVFGPFSKVGNSQRHSTRLDYSSFYGTIVFAVYLSRRSGPGGLQCRTAGQPFTDQNWQLVGSCSLFYARVGEINQLWEIRIDWGEWKGNYKSTDKREHALHRRFRSLCSSLSAIVSCSPFTGVNCNTIVGLFLYLD